MKGSLIHICSYFIEIHTDVYHLYCRAFVDFRRAFFWILKKIIKRFKQRFMENSLVIHASYIEFIHTCILIRYGEREFCFYLADFLNEMLIGSWPYNIVFLWLILVLYCTSYHEQLLICSSSISLCFSRGCIIQCQNLSWLMHSKWKKKWIVRIHVHLATVPVSSFSIVACDFCRQAIL